MFFAPNFGLPPYGFSIDGLQRTVNLRKLAVYCIQNFVSVAYRGVGTKPLILNYVASISYHKYIFFPNSTIYTQIISKLLGILREKKLFNNVACPVKSKKYHFVDH